MAAPYVTLQSMAIPGGSINLSALTSAGGAWNSLQGFSGADWLRLRNNGSRCRKLDGGEQITVPVITGTESTRDWLSTFTADANEISDGQNPAFLESPASLTAVSPTDLSTAMFIDFSVPAARGKFRELGVFMRIGRGTYTVTATLSDSSAGPATWVSPTTSGYGEADAGFKCLFHSGSKDATLAINIARTTAHTDFGLVDLPAIYLAVPVVVPRPRGFAQRQRRQGIFW